MDWSALFIAIGIAHAAFLSAYAAVSARRGSSYAWLATLFALLAAIVTAILVTHRTEGIVESVALVVESTAWFVGPALYAYVRDAMDQPLQRRTLAIHIGLAAVGACAVVFGMFAAPEATALQWAVAPYALAYSVISAIAFARSRRSGDRAARSFWWPLAALAVMFSIHVGQVLRFFTPQAGADAVPLFGALAASIVLLALLISLASRLGAPRYARSSLTHAELQAIAGRVSRALDGPPPLFAKLDLTLAELAAAAGAPPHHVSQALSEVAGASFHEVLMRRRVVDAERRLLDPANAGVAVEALGMEAGFRSRSAFYAAFKSVTGLTPADYRRKSTSNMSAPAGQDMSGHPDTPASV